LNELVYFSFFGSKWNNHSSKNTENFGKLLTLVFCSFFVCLFSRPNKCHKVKKMTFGVQWSFLDYGQNLVENAKNGGII